MEDLIVPSNSWQSRTTNVISRLEYVYDYKLLYDVILDVDGTKYLVHSILLELHSAVFRAMIHGSFNEQKTFPKEFHLQCPRYVIEWVLNFVYRNLKIVDDHQKVQEIYAFAHRWQIDLVLAMCSKYICSHIDESNVIEQYKWAVLYDDGLMKTTCKNVICDRKKFLVANLEELSVECLVDILSYDDLCCREIDIFKGIYLWAKRRLGHGNGMTIKQLLINVVPHIRFLTMDLTDILDIVGPTNVLTDEDFMALLQCYFNGSSILPQTLCPISRPRLITQTNFKVSYSIWKQHIFCKGNKNNKIKRKRDFKMGQVIPHQTVLLNSVAMNSECVDGCWECVVVKKEGGIAGFSSGAGPPWKFAESVILQKSTAYDLYLRGHGNISFHSSASFRICKKGLDIRGWCILCQIVLEVLIS